MKCHFKEWCEKNGYPNLLRYYELGKNEVPSDKIGFSSRKSVTLMCDVCHLSYEIDLNHLTRNPVYDTCPFCTYRRISPFYNFKVVYPELASQWDFKNNEKNPEEYFPTSKERVHWICEFGHEWKDSLANRVNSFKDLKHLECPICMKRVVSSFYNFQMIYPELAKQWDYSKNIILPNEVSPFSNQKVWWICDFNPNHRWPDRIGNRTLLYRGCKQCKKDFAISLPAFVLLYYLSSIVSDVQCEVPFEKKYKVDIMLKKKKIAIEHNGYYFHQRDRIKKDEKKIQLLKKEGYRTIVIQDDVNIKEIICENDLIRYPFSYQYHFLNQMVLKVLEILELPKISVDFKRDWNAISSFSYQTKRKLTLAYRRPDLAKEWSSKNKMGPDMVLPKSNKKVWWKCPNCEQEYPAHIINRVNQNSGCSYCANLRIYEKNSFAYLHPELLKEWNTEKNVGIDPYQISSGKEIRVWWKCRKGHEWNTYLYSRTGKKPSGCPYCSRSHYKVSKETSFAFVSPQLIYLWHPTRNLPLTPNDVTAFSNKKYWFLCKKGHEWSTSLNNLHRTKTGKYCPFCAGRKITVDKSLAIKCPHLLEEWNTEKNGLLNPREISSRSGRNIWWKCSKGHEWFAPLDARTRGSGCPTCYKLKVAKKVI